MSKFLFLFFSFLFISCAGPQKTTADELWPDGSWVNLDNENIKFKKPHRLKKSSRYRLKEDMPIVSRDTAQLRSLQNTLAELEFEDAEIDVFVDTTTYFRVVIICNTERIEINEKATASLKNALEMKYQSMMHKNTTTEVGPTEASFSRANNLALAKFKTEIKYTDTGGRIFETNQLLTAPNFTLVVWEFSDYRADLSKYLWSVKI